MLCPSQIPASREKVLVKCPGFAGGGGLVTLGTADTLMDILLLVPTKWASLLVDIVSEVALNLIFCPFFPD